MLSVEGLTFGYRKHQQQIADVSLALSAGEILGLLGPNGAGKTTLVSLIIGQLRPAAGRVALDGRPVALGQRDVALVPQEYAFYPQLSVTENLAYFAGMLGLAGAQARERIGFALEAGDLGAVRERRARALSGGLKRRLNLAIALLQKPRLLILDEPTANVDPHSRAFILDSLKRINRDGTAIIYTSHLLSEVETLAHQVAVMDAGRIVLNGALPDLLRDERERLHIKTAELPETLARELHAHAEGEHWWVCELDASGLSAADTLGRLERAGLSPEQFHCGSRRLEQVYLNCLARQEAAS